MESVFTCHRCQRFRLRQSGDGFGCGTSFELNLPGLESVNSDQIVDEVLERLSLQKGPESFTPGRYRVLLEQPVVWNIMLTAWQAFAGPRCQNRTSCLSDKLGQKIGADCLNITDYPSHPACGRQFAFDYEGTPSVKVEIMRDGVMTGMLHHLDSAAAFAVPSNGPCGTLSAADLGYPESAYRYAGHLGGGTGQAVPSSNCLTSWVMVFGLLIPMTRSIAWISRRDIFRFPAAVSCIRTENR